MKALTLRRWQSAGQLGLRPSISIPAINSTRNRAAYYPWGLIGVPYRNRLWLRSRSTKGAAFFVAWAVRSFSPNPRCHEAGRSCLAIGYKTFAPYYYGGTKADAEGGFWQALSSGNRGGFLSVGQFGAKPFRPAAVSECWLISILNRLAKTPKLFMERSE